MKTLSFLKSVPKKWKIFLITSLVLGAFLRLLYGNDIEYKGDERFMFEMTQRVGVSEPFPWIGMPSGVGTRNPGMSIWIFLALSRAFFTQTPPELARSVEILNIFALLGLLFFILSQIEEKQKTAWLWAFSFAAVNPLYVLLQRKIWAQSTLPFFCVALIFAWWKRDRFWGAFFLGLLGICIGQIHMSGFFFFAALMGWTLLFSNYLNEKKPFHWKAGLAGCFLGFLPLIPWIQYLLETPSPSNSFLSYFINLDRKPLLTSLFWQLWGTDSSGLSLWYSLGAQHFEKFLEYPLFFDNPTYLITLAHGLILLVLIFSFVQVARILWNNSSWKENWIGFSNESDFLKNSALWGYGIFLSLLGVTIYRHYLLVTFPLEALWLSQLVLRNTKRPKPILGALWVCQLLMAICFLQYIHDHQGAPGGDYGIGYQFQ